MASWTISADGLNALEVASVFTCRKNNLLRKRSETRSETTEKSKIKQKSLGHVLRMTVSTGVKRIGRYLC